MLLPAPDPDVSRVALALRRWHARLWSGPLRRGERRRFSAVVLKTDRIGDFVLGTGAIRSIAAQHGEKNCALIVAPELVALAGREFPAVTIYPVCAFVRHKHASIGWWRARHLLSGIAAEHLFCLRHQRWDYHELMLTWITAARRHVLEDPLAARWVTGRRSVRVPAINFEEGGRDGSTACRELRMHRCLLAQAFARPVSELEVLPALGCSDADQVPQRGLVAPFSSSSLKDLPEATIAAAIESDRSGASLALVGSLAQRTRLERLRDTIARGCRDKSIDVITPESLNGLVDLIGTANWVLTADSAAAHIATALDRPAVVLVGGGCPGQFGPWQRSKRQVWLEHRMACFNCGWRCMHPEPYCLTRIDAAAVAAALVRVTRAVAAP